MGGGGTFNGSTTAHPSVNSLSTRWSMLYGFAKKTPIRVQTDKPPDAQHMTAQGGLARCVVFSLIASVVPSGWTGPLCVFLLIAAVHPSGWTGPLFARRGSPARVNVFLLTAAVVPSGWTV